MSFNLRKFLSPALMLGFLLLLDVLSAAANETELMQLSRYSEDKIVSFDGWYMSEKLDGIRGVWDGKVLRTKQGNPIAAPDWFIAALPPFSLDGELWTKRQDFENIASIVLSREPDERWRQIGFYIFEVPDQAGGLLQRLAVLETYLRVNPSPWLKVVPQLAIQSAQHQGNYFAQIVAQGGEGIVIRDGRKHYQTGRLGSAFKRKLQQEAECRVIGYLPGKGKYQGKVGALECELLADQQTQLFPQLNEKAVIRIGSGLTDKLRQLPPKIDEIITFEYNGLTKYGLPRFARFKRLRPKQTLGAQ